MLPRAVIIGGSVGGLFAANLLLKVGWDVQVYERTQADLSDRGAGIGTREELFAVLERIGAHLDPGSMSTVTARAVLDRDGTAIHKFPLKSISSSWAHLYHSLRATFPAMRYHRGKTLQHIEQDGATVAAIFDDNQRVHGELLIGADGLHSTVRRQFLPGVTPAYAGYVSWRGIAYAEIVPPALRPIVFDHMMFCFPADGMLLTTPMPAAEGSTRPRCQWVWFRPIAEHALPLMCTDANGRPHGLSIPPPLIRPELIAELRTAAREMLPSTVADLIDRVAQPRFQAIFDLEVPKMTFGRVVLLGDSAYVARPHVAAGVTKAALDAASLADALVAGGELKTLLAGYERQRMWSGQRLVARGRRIGARIAQGAASEEDADAIMREYGATAIAESEIIGRA
jgi:2-polyprenyl-6-methoxyphenol hydroxylase-like FAD-dependent oxidoreductase